MKNKSSRQTRTGRTDGRTEIVTPWAPWRSQMRSVEMSSYINCLHLFPSAIVANCDFRTEFSKHTYLPFPRFKSNKLVDTSNKRENQICSNTKSRVESNKLFPFVSLTPGDISPLAPALGEARVSLRLWEWRATGRKKYQLSHEILSNNVTLILPLTARKRWMG